MKRLFLLLSVLVLLTVLAWLAYGWWHPVLKLLSEELQGLEAIVGMVAILGGAVAAFLKFRGKAPAAEPVSGAGRDSALELQQDPAYEPTPLLDTAPALEQDASPYLGLSAFQRADAHLFFGRRRETREALAWLGAQISDGTGDGRYRWLQIEGNSGAGKSSLVNAGLLPLVEQGKLAAQTGLRHWRIIGPMMENALQYLWEQRRDGRLSGALYAEKGGIAGLLELQADALLRRLDKAVPGGKGDALELLLALTRISDQGNHTRRRLSLAESRMTAGGRKADERRGQTIIDYLSGRPGPAEPTNPRAVAGVRLISVTRESAEADTGADGPDAPNNGSYVDLIHETLIRMRGRDLATGKRFGYWRTLYDYIERNRDRAFYREQLARQAGEW
jgi:hypothetical protein